MLQNFLFRSRSARNAAPRMPFWRALWPPGRGWRRSGSFPWPGTSLCTVRRCRRRVVPRWSCRRVRAGDTFPRARVRARAGSCRSGRNAALSGQVSFVFGEWRSPLLRWRSRPFRACQMRCRERGRPVASADCVVRTTTARRTGPGPGPCQPTCDRPGLLPRSSPIQSAGRPSA